MKKARKFERRWQIRELYLLSALLSHWFSKLVLSPYWSRADNYCLPDMEDHLPEIPEKSFHLSALWVLLYSPKKL